MGCDIHLMAEKKIYHYSDEEKKNGVWVNIDKWVMRQDSIVYKGEDGEDDSKMEVSYEDRFYKGRNYNLFTALAGVRSYMFDNEPLMISAPKGLPKDVSKEVERESKKWDSDGHSHSWLTLAEIKNFDWSPYGDTCDEFRVDTVKKLEEAKNHNTTDDEIRVVFWFDN